MVRWKSILLAATLTLPFAATGATLQADSGSPGPFPSPTAEASCVTPSGAAELLGTTQSYKCCWFFHMGQWWCYPCAN